MKAMINWLFVVGALCTLFGTENEACFTGVALMLVAVTLRCTLARD